MTTSRTVQGAELLTPESTGTRRPYPVGIAEQALDIVLLEPGEHQLRAAWPDRRRGLQSPSGRERTGTSNAAGAALQGPMTQVRRTP